MKTKNRKHYWQHNRGGSTTLVLGTMATVGILTAALYNSNTRDSVKEVLDLLCELDGFENVNIQYRADKPQSSTSRRFSAQLIINELGFKPKIDLREGLQRTLTWYRTRQLASLEK